MPEVHAYLGRLERSPSRGRPVLARMDPLPLRTEADFAALRRTAPRQIAPIRVGFVEKYELLAALCRAARAHLPSLDLIFVAMNMPCGLRLPADLLREDVLIWQCVEEEARRAVARGLCVLTIQDRLVRHMFEAGDNSLALTWTAERRQDDAFERFAATLPGLGFADARALDPVS